MYQMAQAAGDLKPGRKNLNGGFFANLPRSR